MHLRPANHDDWQFVWPFFDAIVREGRTYAYPDNMDPVSAGALWMEDPPGLTVVAVDDGHIVGSAKMGPNRRGRGATSRPPASWSILPPRATEPDAP